MTTPIPIELEPEVDDWLAGLSSVDFRQAAAAIERLELHGHMLRMPYSRSLGGALFELRFLCEGVQRRITYWFVPEGKVVLLTTFRKRRSNERREIERAREALRRCRTVHESEAGDG